MNRHPLFVRIAFCLVLGAGSALTACGNKGPLVLPDKPGAEAPDYDDAPSGEAPAETSTQTPAGTPTPAAHAFEQHAFEQHALEQHALEQHAAKDSLPSADKDGTSAIGR